MIGSAFKNKLYISLLFGSYLILVGFFFGAGRFLSTEVNPYIYNFLVLIIASLLEFSFIQVIDKSPFEGLIKRIFFATSFLITSVLTSIFLWWLLSEGQGFLLIYLTVFIIASILPALMSILIFIFEDAQSNISAAIHYPEQEEGNSTSNVQTFVLQNEAGKQILKVTTDNLICFEANDNYVVTHYLDKDGKPKKSMDRCSLKKIDDILHSSEIRFERVHKSYIINPDYIDALKGKAQAYKLQLRHFEALIPVSRSYDISVLQKN